MTIYWNTITDREISILRSEETDEATLRHLFDLATEPRPAGEESALLWIACRAQLARRWNARHAAAFERAEQVLAALVAERDAEDERRVGAKLWPREQFDDIRWRSIDPRGGWDGRHVEVAWHDSRGQLRIAQARMLVGRAGPAGPPAPAWFGGDEPGRDATRIAALLAYDMALEERTGIAMMKDPDA